MIVEGKVKKLKKVKSIKNSKKNSISINNCIEQQHVEVGTKRLCRLALDCIALNNI